MTAWRFYTEPKTLHLLIYKTEEGQPEVLVGKREFDKRIDQKTNTYLDMVEVAGDFKPGDFIDTPELKTIILEPQGESNN